MSAEKSLFFIVILGLFCFFFSPSLHAQFAPAPPNINSSAIHKNDTSFSFWANSIELKRGWQNIADTSLGKTTVGTEQSALNVANNSVISLGDKGSAILKFPFTIYNVSGFDFAIFENGFAQNGLTENEYFLELAIVSVSQNGIDFIPFESTSLTDNYTQLGSFESINCTKINNLAGKYPINYGTPFDMNELGLDSIVAIKITDVVGTIDSNYASFDSQGNIINDPYPTAFASGGFDLNAVGAINQPYTDTTQNNDTTTTNIFNNSTSQINIFPNPVFKGTILNVESTNLKSNISIFNTLGKRIFFSTFKEKIRINTATFMKGIYFIKLNKQGFKIIVN